MDTGSTLYKRAQASIARAKRRNAKRLLRRLRKPGRKTSGNVTKRLVRATIPITN